MSSFWKPLLNSAEAVFYFIFPHPQNIGSIEYYQAGPPVGL